MKWCSVSHTSSNPSSSAHSICSSSRWMMSRCRSHGGAWKTKNVPKRIGAPPSILADPGHVLERGDDRGDVLAAAAARRRRGAELAGEAGQGQGHAEAAAFLEHQVEVLEEEIELHLRLGEG